MHVLDTADRSVESICVLIKILEEKSFTWINSNILTGCINGDKICIFVFKKSMELLGEDHYIC